MSEPQDFADHRMPWYRLEIDDLRRQIIDTKLALERECVSHAETSDRLHMIMHAHLIAGFCTEDDLTRCACDDCVRIANDMEEAGYLDPGTAERVEGVYKDRSTTKVRP